MLTSTLTCHRTNALFLPLYPSPSKYIYSCSPGSQVNAQYPNGAYLKINDDLTEVKVSNFNSAAQGIFWAICLGSGDGGNINPTTSAGRCVCVTVMIRE